MLRDKRPATPKTATRAHPDNAVERNQACLKPALWFETAAPERRVFSFLKAWRNLAMGAAPCIRCPRGDNAAILINKSTRSRLRIIPRCRRSYRTTRIGYSILQPGTAMPEQLAFSYLIERIVLHWRSIPGVRRHCALRLRCLPNLRLEAKLEVFDDLDPEAAKVIRRGCRGRIA